MLTRIWTAMRRLDDSWLGDLLGACLLVVIFAGLMLLVAAFQVPA